MKKYIQLSDNDIRKLSRVILNQSFDIYTIVKMNGKNVMFFHNDLPTSKDGVNEKMIKKFLRLSTCNKVDNFICCYPETTCINKYCYLGSNAKGEIGTGQDNKGMYLYTVK